MSRAKKLNGRPGVLVPADILLALTNAYLNPLTAQRPFFAEMQTLQTKAYRKVQEQKHGTE